MAIKAFNKMHQWPRSAKINGRVLFHKPQYWIDRANSRPRIHKLLGKLLSRGTKVSLSQHFCQPSFYLIFVHIQYP